MKIREWFKRIMCDHRYIDKIGQRLVQDSSKKLQICPIIIKKCDKCGYQKDIIIDKKEDKKNAFNYHPR